MNNEMLKLTQLLYSCWIVSAPQEEAAASMPTSGAVLDHALRDAVNKGAFPEWARKQLHFVSSDSGLTCLELPSMQRIATELKFTSNPNPSYTRTHIVVGLAVARRCLAKLEIDEAQACQWGSVIRAAAASMATENVVTEA